ncbi:MAG: phospho-sugar mutase [Clostridia bacterium]|nr:phospho-sugar mutase [Clostridia bacterium]
MSEFERWLERACDEEIQRELRSVVGCEREIEDRFYKALTFGTGGLRGVIGAGTNRMNRYTVGRATCGLAAYLSAHGGKSIVVAYDSRNKSDFFARLAAQIMSSYGIRAYLFSELTPTPVLSFAVRYLGADAGIVITASHNPKEYNGYKVYNSLGCQITDAAAREITEEINACDYFDPYTPDERLITVLDARVEDAFVDAIKRCSLTKITPDCAPSIVYSPLNGTGRRYVSRVLREIGITELHIVREQESPDGNFTTCPYPNPEERDALTLALRDAAIYRPDLVMATDPDADRIGIAVPDHAGEYVLLNGNETGSILLYYILCKRREQGIPCAGATVIKTIVTTDIIFDMAREHGALVREVLTGFKYIGEALETTEDYLLGLEESYGYLVGTHARDKDAVSAAMMIAEACAYFKGQGKSMYDLLGEIYERYGYYQTALRSISMPGRDGMERMERTLAQIRQNPPRELGGQALAYDDFSQGLYGLPKSDVLRFKSEDYRVIIRPSGTEPKMKIYLQAKGASRADAEEKMKQMNAFPEELLA